MLGSNLSPLYWREDQPTQLAPLGMGNRLCESGDWVLGKVGVCQARRCAQVVAAVMRAPLTRLSATAMTSRPRATRLRARL